MWFNGLLIPTLLLAFVLFFVGRKMVRRCRTPVSRAGVVGLFLLLGVPGVMFPFYYLHWMKDSVGYYEFRAIPFIELSAAGMGLSTGALAELLKGSKLFSVPVLMILLTLGIVAPYLKPMLKPLPPDSFSDRWSEEVCLQSTPSSCGAAAAATVFKAFGITLREEEVARECFTYQGGTENWYLARAFRKRGLSVRYRIEKGLPADLKTPAIAGVRVGNFGHFIVILERTADGYVTGDPLVGRQRIPVDQMEQEFDFTGFYMEVGER
ncbi:MAG: hypothetical protein JXR40_12275 [Pontiellaceae bacterium]|nr:hypothetical protein [Pontiellaceae bacterium]